MQKVLSSEATFIPVSLKFNLHKVEQFLIGQNKGKIAWQIEDQQVFT